MVYGQVKFPDGSFYSIANMLDVVGHEMFHDFITATTPYAYEPTTTATFMTIAVSTTTLPIE